MEMNSNSCLLPKSAAKRGLSSILPKIIRLIAILAVGVVFGYTTRFLLMRPVKTSTVRILPGNGYTHQTHLPGCWEIRGTDHPDFMWHRVEHGADRAWLVHDTAVGGTQEYFRVDSLSLLVYDVYGCFAGIVVVGAILTPALIRCCRSRYRESQLLRDVDPRVRMAGLGHAKRPDAIHPPH